jgi:hypothetical protein
MGVEPTRAAFKHPSNGFEDREAHQDSTAPRSFASIHLFRGIVKSLSCLWLFADLVLESALLYASIVVIISSIANRLEQD